MSGYDAATVEACALAADNPNTQMNYDNWWDGYDSGRSDAAAEAIRALPLAPPAPLQVTADDLALIEVLHHAGSGLRAGLDWMDGEFKDSDYDQNGLLAEANATMFVAHHAVQAALARRAAPAVDETVADWWKPDADDPYWMLEAEDGEWLKNQYSKLGTRDPIKAMRFPTKADAEKHTWLRGKWWAAQGTEHKRAAAPDLLALLKRIEPHIDAIVCYASTRDEHEPNKLAVDLRAALKATGV